MLMPGQVAEEESAEFLLCRVRRFPLNSMQNNWL